MLKESSRWFFAFRQSAILESYYKHMQRLLLLDDMSHAERLSKAYGVCLEDVILISLNACGLRTKFNTPRLRLNLRMCSRPDEEFFLILSTNRTLSPFVLEDGVILIYDTPIASVRQVKDDNAVIGYFRRDNTAITLNSNSRSHCTGCVFCPNTLGGAADPPQITAGELTESLRLLAQSRTMHDLRSIVDVTLSTGCFGNETAALDHLNLVRESLTELSCSAQIGLLTSVVQSDSIYRRIANEVGRFQIFLTVECFRNRDIILKASKASLTLDLMPTVLERARRHGHDTSFTYIVGLDEADVALPYIDGLKPHLTRFPNFQVYQPHNGLMDVFCARGADTLDFYLQFRRGLEDMFASTGLRPLSWMNYRPLWYFEFAGEPLSGIRI